MDWIHVGFLWYFACASTVFGGAHGSARRTHRPGGRRAVVHGAGGGPAFGADVALAFDGADVTLLLVTIGIVALLLIGT